MLASTRPLRLSEKHAHSRKRIHDVKPVVQRIPPLSYRNLRISPHCDSLKKTATLGLKPSITQYLHQPYYTMVGLVLSNFRQIDRVCSNDN